MAMDFTEILHNLETAVLERNEEKTVSLIGTFGQNVNESGEI